LRFYINPAIPILHTVMQLNFLALLLNIFYSF